MANTYYSLFNRLEYTPEVQELVEKLKPVYTLEDLEKYETIHIPGLDIKEEVERLYQILKNKYFANDMKYSAGVLETECPSCQMTYRNTLYVVKIMKCGHHHCAPCGKHLKFKCKTCDTVYDREDVALFEFIK